MCWVANLIFIQKIWRQAARSFLRQRSPTCYNLSWPRIVQHNMPTGVLNGIISTLGTVSLILWGHWAQIAKLEITPQYTHLSQGKTQRQYQAGPLTLSMDRLQLNLDPQALQQQILGQIFSPNQSINTGALMTKGQQCFQQNALAKTDSLAR